MTTYRSKIGIELMIPLSILLVWILINLINTTIHIRSIKTIRESSSILDSAAASLDRLEIIYNDNDSTLISPREKEKFIEHLQRINPHIIFIKKRM